MTATQRRRQNKLNAQKSTGPKTEDGKARSRQNALKHGFTALELVLPTETPEILQAEADRWFDSIQPKGTQEIELTNLAALAAIRLSRLAKAEASILDEQIRTAEDNWERDIDLKLVDMLVLMRRDPRVPASS